MYIYLVVVSVLLPLRVRDKAEYMILFSFYIQTTGRQTDRQTWWEK